ncbi:MAG: anthranilate/aminodeoxychorismate synthase component II [Deltaproteobacteria bacterium RIFCSPHIGHO2_12_FULL_43_9]|nr:MAG: anthranilate/aminodeoxychorismate synthase component II [Deltaproteobacteria bacterium RIFCSPHIGHO2_12_FULL_43_9]
MIDNFDSFTYILVDYFRVLGAEVDVFRNNEIGLQEIEKAKYDAIIISPGPKSPADSGISIPVILRFGATIPILGVCLGHQAIGQAFGGRVVHADTIMHGKTSLIYHESKGLFDGTENPFYATRYHSLVIDPDSMTTEIKIDATTEDGTIMAISHKILPIYGVQFHPESILTRGGIKILANFIDLARTWNLKYIS